VVDRVVVRARAHRLVELPEAEPLERRRLQPHRLDAELGHDPGCAREQQVPGEDRDGVAPDGVRGRRPPAYGRGVHDVVVVERREVRQLDDDGRFEDLGPGGVTEVAGDESEHRPDALATREDEVPGGVVGEAVRLGDGLDQPRLHLTQPRPDGFVQGRVRQAEVQRGRHRCRTGSRHGVTGIVTG